MSRRAIIVTAVVLCVALGAGLATFALAQPGGQGGFGQRGGGGAMMGPMQGMPVAIATTPDAVFVVSGRRLYRFDAHSLQLMATGEIPVPQPLAGMPPQ